MLKTVKQTYVIVTLNNLLAIYSPQQVERLTRITRTELESAASNHSRTREVQLGEMQAAAATKVCVCLSVCLSDVADEKTLILAVHFKILKNS